MTEDNTVTVSEFIPAEEIPNDDRNMLRILQPTDGGGLEVAAHEPYEDTVNEHKYICDECGQVKTEEGAMAKHVQFKHD